MMVAVNSVWDVSSLEDQAAFHRVTVKDSQDPDDLDRVKRMSERIQLAMTN